MNPQHIVSIGNYLGNRLREVKPLTQGNSYEVFLFIKLPVSPPPESRLHEEWGFYLFFSLLNLYQL